MKTVCLRFLLALCVLVGYAAQVEAQSYAQQVAEGEALVQEFGRLFQGHASMEALEEMAVRISQNYQARLLLKNQYKDLGRIYHNIWLRGQGSLSRRMIDKARAQLRDLGYSGRAVDDLQVISNVASAREMKAPMDLDIGVSTMGREQTREFIRELRDQGKSPQMFLDDLQEALDQAYREVANESLVLEVDPRRAFVTGTAAWHPEAYADLDVLNELPPGRTLVEQTVDVSKRKVNEMRILVSENVLTMDAAILEAGRGTLKDVRKLRAGFAEIERVYGISPELKGTNAWIVEQLEGLARGDLLPQQAAARFHARGLNIFEACNQVMDQLEAAWKLAPSSKPQGLLMALFRNYLPRDTYMDFVRALKGEGIESVSGRAGTIVKQLRNIIGANFVSLQGVDARAFIAQFKAQYTGVIFQAGDKKLAQLLEYVRKSAGVDELIQVVGESFAPKLAELKALIQEVSFQKSAARFLSNNIPLPSVDERTNRLILGDVDDNLNMDAALGVISCLHEMNGIVDQGFPREQENQQLAEAFARNLPLVGEFFQGVVDGHAGYLEGDRRKMAEGGVYLFIGASGLVPGGQVPALVAGLGMVSVQLGASAWDTSTEKELIQAVLDSGIFEPDKGTLHKILTRENRALTPDYARVVRGKDWHFQTGLSGSTMRDAVYAWSERYFLAGFRAFATLKQGFLSLYPDFDLEGTLKEPMNTGRSLLATRILDQGGNPRRDAAMALFVQMKRIYEQAGEAAFKQIVQVAEQEYQARHHTGQALRIHQELDALGERLRLPLVDNTRKIFGSFSSFVRKAFTFPWVRDSLALQQSKLQKRYLEGYLRIERGIESIQDRMAQVGVNPPQYWGLTGFLDIDGPRMQDLKKAYMNQGIGRARQDAARITQEAGAEGPLDIREPCAAKLFQKLARIRISLVHRQDLKLLMAQRQGKASAAAQSRDRALARAQSQVTDQSLPSAAWDRLSTAYESAYAWTEASMPWSGGYDVYSDAVDAVAGQIAKLEKEYSAALKEGKKAYIACVEAQEQVGEEKKEEGQGPKQDPVQADEGEPKNEASQTPDGGDAQEGPSEDGGPTDKDDSSTAEQALRFAGSVPFIWNGGNYEKGARRGFHFERSKASKNSSDKELCPHPAVVRAEVWGKVDPSFAPGSQEEIVKKLKQEIEDHQRWGRKAEMRPISIGKFKGQFTDSKVKYSKGYWSLDGYSSGGVGAYGHGYVLKGSQCIELGYKVHGSGCFNNSDKPFLLSQAAAAQSEARAVIAGLTLVHDGAFAATPYTGPKLDGSDTLQVGIEANAQGPYRAGQQVELRAVAGGGKPPYTYTWEGNVGSSGYGPRATFVASKPDRYTVTVTLQDSAGLEVTATKEVTVEALKAEISGVLPQVVYGQSALLSVDIQGGLPAGGSDGGSGAYSQVSENQAYIPHPDKEEDTHGLTYIWQSEPGLDFEQTETYGPTTRVTYDRMGTVKLWAQIVSVEGGVRSTIGETPQVTATVQAPQFSVSFSPAQGQGRLGQEVRARITASPDVPADLIDYRWFAPPSSNRMEYADNSARIGFTVDKTEGLELHALARVPVHGDEISEIRKTYTGAAYQVEVSVQDQGPPAMTWDPKAKGLVQVPRGTYATDARILLQAELIGDPKPDSLRWKWQVNPGTFLSNSIARTPTVSRHEPGNIQARVEARNADGLVLASGSISVPVVAVDSGPGTRPPDGQDAPQAERLERIAMQLAKAKEEARLGKLGEAMATASEALAMDPGNTVVETYIQRVKKIKAKTDRDLERVADLIEADRYLQAQRALIPLKNAVPYYPQVQAMERRLGDAWRAWDQEVKTALGQIRMTYEQGKYQEALDLIQQTRAKLNLLPSHLETLRDAEQYCRNLLAQKAKRAKRTSVSGPGKVSQEPGLSAGASQEQGSSSKQAQATTSSIKLLEEQAWLEKAKRLFKQGKLQKAIEIVEERARLNPTNKEAATLANKWKAQKEAADRQVKKIQILIEGSRLMEAKTALARLKESHTKYPPILEAERLLNKKLRKPINAASVDVRGVWRHGEDGETWTFKPNGDGTYTAIEKGFGNARGTATVQGNRIRVEYVTGDGRVNGVYELTVAPNGQSASGTWQDSRPASGAARWERISSDPTGHGPDQGVAEPSSPRAPSGQVSTSSTYVANARGDVFAGGHWAGARNGQDWIQRNFDRPQRIKEISIARASTDVTTEGFRLVLKLQQENGQWVVVDELHNTNINRAQLSYGNKGYSIPSYRKILDPPLLATAFRLEFHGHGWFDATDIRLIPADTPIEQGSEIGTGAAAAETDGSHVLRVQSDKNVLNGSDSYASASSYIIDQDESEGWVRLVFEDPQMEGRSLSGAVLIATIAPHRYADSQDGFQVFLGESRIGSSGPVRKGEVVECPLALPESKSLGRIELILKAAGTDGVYIQSKASGNGARLRLKGSSQKGDGIDITGVWQQSQEHYWTFIPLENGRYRAVEKGSHQASGEAVLRGNKVRIDFKYQVHGKPYRGFYELTLNEQGNRAAGRWETTRPASGVVTLRKVSEDLGSAQ